MTIHIEDGLEPYVHIAPLKIRFDEPRMAEALFVSSEFDNLHSFATFKYRLGTLTDALDPDGNFVNHNSASLYESTIIMGGDTYINWPNDNVTPFQFVVDYLSQFGLVVID